MKTNQRKYKIIHSILDTAYPIELSQRGPDDFCVIYGKQVKATLTYAEAAHEFGECLFHALACDGKLDNNTKG